MYSSHLVDDTDKMHILVDGRNTSDHFAISRSCPLKRNRVYSTACCLFPVSVPEVRVGIDKHWWTSELEDL